MTPRRAIVTLACLAAAGLAGIGVSELPGGSPSGDTRTGASARRPTAAQTKALLAGSPPALATVHDQAGEILDGGARALRARLATLRGYPIVINKWASWCVPCKQELGAFQRASVEYGRRVAFLGIDSGDSSRGDAAAFLGSFLLSYPSYYDRSGTLGEQVTDSSFTPVTMFIGRDGRQFIHQGQYLTLAKLKEDIQRYALDA